MKKSLAITLAAAALILVAALATVAVLSALAGQQSGLEKSTAARCATAPPAAAHAAAGPHHGEHLIALSRCMTSQDR